MSIIVKSIITAVIMSTLSLVSTNAQADSMTRSPLALLAPAELEGTLNINEASATQLEMLPGIGPVTAQKIVVYRQRHPFADPLHLLRVKGVGRKTYNRIKPFLTVEGPTTLHRAGAKGTKSNSIRTRA